MSAGREKRRRLERAMRKAGVAVVARDHINPAHLAAPFGGLAALVASIENTLERLVEAGGDITGHLVITIGPDHPEYPGKVTVEAKAADTVATA